MCPWNLVTTTFKQRTRNSGDIKKFYKYLPENGINSAKSEFVNLNFGNVSVRGRFVKKL